MENTYYFVNNSTRKLHKITGTLDRAKSKALLVNIFSGNDNYDIVIYDQDAEEVARRVYHPEKFDQERAGLEDVVLIDNGDGGYYGPWNA